MHSFLRGNIKFKTSNNINSKSHRRNHHSKLLNSTTSQNDIDQPQSNTKTLSRFLLLCFLIFESYLLSQFAFIDQPIPPLAGNPIWFGTGFLLVFTLWFGMWGYLGCTMGSLLAVAHFSNFEIIPILGNLMGHLILLIIPFLIFRSRQVDRGLRDTRSRITWIISALIASTLGGIGFQSPPLLFGLLAPSNFVLRIVSYAVSSSFSILVIGTPLLVAFTPTLEKSPLYTQGHF